MVKKFEMSEILNAVESISKIKKVKSKEIRNDLTSKGAILTHNNQVKSDKSDILVLDQMIE